MRGHALLNFAPTGGFNARICPFARCFFLDPTIFTHVDVEQCSAAYAQLGAADSLSIVAIESMLSWTHMSNSWTTLRENDCLIISDFLAPAVAGEGVRGRWTAEKWDYSVIPEPVAVMVDQ